MKSYRTTIFFCLFFLSLPSFAFSFHVRTHVANEPPTLDWNKATDNVSYRILTNVMEGLCQYDENLNPIPALASSWKISPDGRSYTFYLRKDVVWSDGVPFEAKHVYDSWIRLLDPKTAAEYAYFLYDIQGAKDFNSGKKSDPNQVGIYVLDRHTLSVHLNKPAVYFPAITTFMVTYPIRKDIIQKHGNTWTEPKHMVNLGPFSLRQWKHEYKVVLAKNSKYYGSPKPQVETLTYFIINEGTTALSLYETQGLDFVELPPIAIDHYKKHPHFVRQNKLRGYYFGFHTQKAPFDNPLVRKAFSMAINRKEFPTILRGGELPTTSWIPPGMLGYNADIGLGYNPEKARELLKKAGFPQGQGFPRIVVAFNTDPLNRMVSENIQAQIKKELNIDLVLDNQEWKVYLHNLSHDTPMMYRLGWGADFPDPDNFMNLFTSRSGNNYTYWKNPEYDRLIELAAGIQNTQQRQKYYDQAQRILLEKEVPIISLFVVATNYLAKPRLENLALSPMGFIYWKTVREARMPR